MERCLTDLEERPQDAGLIGRYLPLGAYDQGNHGISGLQAAGEAGPRGREPAGAAARGQAGRGRADHYRASATAGRAALDSEDDRSGQQRGRRRRCGADWAAGRVAGSRRRRRKRAAGAHAGGSACGGACVAGATAERAAGEGRRRRAAACNCAGRRAGSA